LKEPSMAKMSSMHFYAWEKGLKTGISKISWLYDI